MSVNERIARSVALEEAYVHDVYEQFCDNPRSKPWPRVQQFLETLDPGSIVCDVGCGNGKYLNVNTSIFNIGGEKCSRLSDVAREKENEVLVLDNLSLPFRDESLDAVLSIAVVHHFATTERRVCALRELARVLRIGGRLIISVWAMEQSHRKFESQDVLVPWHRPQHLSTPSLELTSTTNTPDDDGPTPYHAYTQSDTDSNKSCRGKSSVKKRGRTRHRGRSIDPKRNSSPSSSSLSSPNETCYSFVRRAIQKLAGGKRVHRPWFLESWTACTKDIPQKRYDPDGCECCDENIQDLPIELRRVDDEEMPQRRQTFPSSQIFNDIYNNLKSRSMTNIKTVENNNIVRSQSSVPSIQESTPSEAPLQTVITLSNTLNKPKLVKQKKSICEEDPEEALDEPTEMKQVNSHSPESKIFNTRYSRINVLKQRSLNEELMSTERLHEKERLRQNIQKQTSLNEDLIYHRHHAFDSLRDSIFSASTAKRFQLIKTGFTNKIKNSTTNIEKVTGTSLKNGFVRIFQNWTSSELISPTISEDDALLTPKKIPVIEEMKESTTERRHSKEDGSDSSKDSSLQSDTSVDSEDSFASVIFVPKSDPMSPNLSPGPTSPRVNNSSVPNSPRIKQSSCPTSPRIKQMPLSIYPLTKQLSSPKPSSTISKFPDIPSPTESNCSKSDRDQISENTTPEAKNDKRKVIESLAQKYAVQKIPKFKSTSLNSGVSTEKTPKEKPETKDKAESLKEIRELLIRKPGFGVRSSRPNFPIVRHTSVNNGKLEATAKPLPKLLSLELFNPETDDKDSDSSAVSSPDSVDSVISVDVDNNGQSTELTSNTKFAFPDAKSKKENCLRNGGKVQQPAPKNTLLEAAAEVANSLDEAVDKVIRSSPRARRREIKAGEVISVMQRQYSIETIPLLSDEIAVDLETSWNDECHKHLSDFADKLSEKLLHEIDQYQGQSRNTASSLGSAIDHINDPYINRLSEELQDLSKLSAEIQKQNEYLAQLSASDKLFPTNCANCKSITCKCTHNRKQSESIKCRDRSDFRSSKANLKMDKVPFSDASAKSSELRDNRTDDSFNSLDRYELESVDILEVDFLGKSLNKNTIKTGTSIESCDSEKGSSPNSMLSSVTTSSHFGHSVESTEDFSDRGSTDKDTSSISRYSDGGSTASLASCPDWKSIRNKSPNGRSSSEDKAEQSKASASKRRDQSGLNPSLSDTSQESLPSDNIGGEITYHRYYHVFREGELDQLIEKYVENLHIISSYYDHASWCIVAEKVQVWTI